MKSAEFLEKIAFMKTTTVLMIMVVLGYVYYSNIYDSGAELEAQITALRATVATETEKKALTEKAKQEADEARKSVNRLAQDFDRISKRLPSDLASVDMNKAINGFVSQSGLKQISIRPGTEFDGEIYQRYPFSVQLEGNFSQIALFLYSVAKAERIAAVKEFTIVRANPLGDEPLKFDAVVTNYKLAEEKKTKKPGQGGTE